MSLSVTCPKCNKQFGIQKTSIGKLVQCLHCGHQSAAGATTSGPSGSSGPRVLFPCKNCSKERAMIMNDVAIAPRPVQHEMYCRSCRESLKGDEAFKAEKRNAMRKQSARFARRRAAKARTPFLGFPLIVLGLIGYGLTFQQDDVGWLIRIMWLSLGIAATAALFFMDVWFQYQASGKDWGFWEFFERDYEEPGYKEQGSTTVFRVIRNADGEYAISNRKDEDPPGWDYTGTQLGRERAIAHVKSLR